MAFRRGTSAIEQDSKRAKARAGSWGKTEYLSTLLPQPDAKNPEPTAVVRFVTEMTELITVDQHNYVPTRPKPSDHEGNWPGHMSAVCRNDPAFEGTESRYPGCYICANIPEKKDGKEVPRTPWPRVFGLAVVRQEVSPGIYADELRERGKSKDDKDKEQAPSEPVMEPRVVVVNYADGNFFGQIRGIGNLYHTIRDRDIFIKREGGGANTTKYLITPLDRQTSAVADPVPEFMEIFLPGGPDGKSDPVYAQVACREAVWPSETTEMDGIELRLQSPSWKMGDYVEDQGGTPLFFPGSGDPITDEQGNQLTGFLTLPPPMAITVEDGRDPRFAARYAGVYDLEAIVTASASDDYVGHFWDPNYVRPKKDGDDSGSEASSNGGGSTQATQAATADRLAGLRAAISDKYEQPAAQAQS